MLPTVHETVDGHRVRVARLGAGPPLVLLGPAARRPLTWPNEVLPGGEHWMAWHAAPPTRSRSASAASRAKPPPSGETARARVRQAANLAEGSAVRCCLQRRVSNPGCGPPAVERGSALPARPADGTRLAGASTAEVAGGGCTRGGLTTIERLYQCRPASICRSSSSGPSIGAPGSWA